jgi:hypothetical protein
MRDFRRVSSAKADTQSRMPAPVNARKFSYGVISQTVP